VDVVLEIGGAGVGTGKIRGEPPGMLEQSVTRREGGDSTRVLHTSGPPLRRARDHVIRRSR
jgi:hypothetical protein